MPAQAIRQAVLLLAFFITIIAMGLSMLRGADLMHVAFTGLWVMPLSALIIFHIFRLWFLVLMKTIREKRDQALSEAAETATPNDRATRH